MVDGLKGRIVELETWQVKITSRELFVVGQKRR
jgi:hypothetical protein